MRRLVLGATLAFALQARAAGQFIEDIRFSRVGDEATIVIDLACPMRFQSDTRTSGGVLLEIRVAPLDACRQLGIGSGFASERTRPVGGQLAHLVEVEIESLGPGDAIVMLEFNRAVQYEISQRAGLRSLELKVALDDTPEPATLTVPSTMEPSRNAAPAGTPERAEPARAPMRLRIREPETASDYVVNLQSKRALSDIDAQAIAPEHDRLLYVSQTEIGGEPWYRLRLGFFASEQDARTALGRLAGKFPRAWIGRAEPQEVATAEDFVLDRGEFYVESATPPETAPMPTVDASPSERLSPERIAALMAEARDGIVSGDLETAIRNYTRVLQEPGPHRAEARELLGVAREKNGQIAHARAEYRAYLEEFDSELDVRRVTQRLNGLAAGSAAPRTLLRPGQIERGATWDFGSGVSQYYRRYVNQFDEDQDEIVTFSALISDVDFSLRRSGDAVDLIGRVAMSHFYDMLENPSSSRSSNASDPTRISYAYLDVDATNGRWSIRSGRQSLHNWGVLGRFDGLHLVYDWNGNRRVHYQMGYPVESTRHSVETDRLFQGAAIEFDDLVGRWDIGAYVNQQSIESIDDRKAVGIEARYADDRRSMTGMLDYDVLYGQLNSALVLGTWRMGKQLTLSALHDRRLSPFLTTRNALIGQPISTIEEMLLVWSVEEIERIALDRTARSATTTLGLAKPLGERFQLNADVTFNTIDATIASVGVAATPSTGRQTFVSTTLIGSGLFGSGDVTILSLRRGSADAYEISQVTWDARFPVGRRLRLNPRIRYAVWQSLLDGGTRDTIGASFSLLLRLRNHYRLELELGKDEIERVGSSGAVQLSSGSFFNVGYRADF